MESQTLSHSFLYDPDCPVNLLRHYLLTKMGITIYCNAQGLKLCSTLNRPQEKLLTSCTYLLPLIPANHSLRSSGLPCSRRLWPHQRSSSPSWSGFLIDVGFLTQSLPLYRQLHDFTRWALSKWVGGTAGKLQRTDQDQRHFCGKRGGSCSKPNGLGTAVLYQFQADSIPHITLTVRIGHEACSLGPMVKRGLGLNWAQTATYMLFQAQDRDTLPSKGIGTARPIPPPLP